MSKTPRELEIEELLRKKRDSLRKQLSRAKNSNTLEPDEAELAIWEIEFDIERLRKEGGLIDVHEVAPFVLAETPDEKLNTCRIFAHVFRKYDRDILDIQPEETIGQFCFRVVTEWYAKTTKKGLCPFVCLSDFTFDDDMGFNRDGVPFDASYFLTDETLNKTVEVTTLPRIGREPMQWEREGLSYIDWKRKVDEQEQKRKRKEQLQKDLSEAQPEPSKAPAGNTPTLLYKAILPEKL
jgi:hypothetical protein